MESSETTDTFDGYDNQIIRHTEIAHRYRALEDYKAAADEYMKAAWKYTDIKDNEMAAGQFVLAALCHKTIQNNEMAARIYEMAALKYIDAGNNEMAALQYANSALQYAMIAKLYEIKGYNQEATRCTHAADQCYKAIKDQIIND